MYPSCTRIFSKRLNVEFFRVVETKNERRNKRKTLFSSERHSFLNFISREESRTSPQTSIARNTSCVHFFSLYLSFPFSVCNSGNEHATYTSNIIPMKRMENTIARAKDRERDKDRRVNRARRIFNRPSFLHRVNLPFPYLLVFGYQLTDQIILYDRPQIILYRWIDYIILIIQSIIFTFHRIFFYTFFNHPFSSSFAILFDEKKSKHE